MLLRVTGPRGLGGGLSGPAIKPIALRAVYQAAQAVKIPLVGIGGIATIDDVMGILVAGAAAVQIGTANFYRPTVSYRYCWTPCPSPWRELGRRCRFDRGGSGQPIFTTYENPKSTDAENHIIMRVLSGIQPTGRFHWGNYFGAIRQYIELQDKPENAFYFIANLHGLTTVRDRPRLWQNTLDAAVDLLALGWIPIGRRSFCNPTCPRSASYVGCS